MSDNGNPDSNTPTLDLPEPEAPEPEWAAPIAADAAEGSSPTPAAPPTTPASSPRRMLPLKPGYLIALSTQVRGNVNYAHKDLDGEKTARDVGAVLPTSEGDVEAWETVKTVQDRDEYERAIKARSKFRSLITGTCIKSAFGLLCAPEKIDEFYEKLEEAEAIRDAFNQVAKITRIDGWSFAGAIAESDTRAAAGLAAEMRDLLDEMKRGIDNLDADVARAAASKALSLNTLINDEKLSKSVRVAIEEVRKNAREFVKAAKVSADDATRAIVEIKNKALDEARFAFLDFAEPVVIPGEALPPVDLRQLDVEPVPDTEGGAATGGPPEAIGASAAAAAEPAPRATDQGVEETADEPVTPNDVDASRAVDADAVSYAASAASALDLDL